MLYLLKPPAFAKATADKAGNFQFPISNNMRHLLLAFLLLAFCPLPHAQTPITLEDIWQNGTFSSKGVPGFNFQKDGVHFTKIAGSTIEQYDLRTGDKTGVILDLAALKTDAKDWTGKFDGYSFNDDESKILLGTATEQIYRWSSKSQFFVYDQKTKQLARLHDGPKQRYVNFSPDGSKAAFVVENDLYYKDLVSGKTTRVTTDGKINEIINGASDWVYEEEFELIRAFEWSPDGQKIAFLRFDESQVPEVTLDLYTGGPYPVEETFKYPKVGEKNSVVTSWIYDLASGRKTQVSLPRSEGLDDYLPRIAWTPNGRLCLTWMNRHQDNLKLWLADPATGATTLLLDEKSKYYLDLKEPSFLADGSGFIWESEKSGFNHLYKHDMTGKEVAALTKGNWEVTGFYGVDEKNGQVFYQAAAKNAMQREIYSAKLNGKGQKKLTKEKGVHTAQFSSTFDYYVNTYSTLNTPPQFNVYDRTGKLIRKLEQNDHVRELQADRGVTPAEFFSFKTSEKVELNGWMIKPTDPQYAGKKLPVLMFVYGGPGSQQVLDQWKGANYWWFEMLAQKGYVVACVDNRGTGGRGEEFKKMTYLNMGKMETQDQIEAAKYMGTLPFVDSKRVGIFGWSYGGYMSSLCMLKGKEVFKSGIAVAPVTNWKWYDSIYSERYMRTEQENPKGFEENSPVNFADQLEGNYLLVHGLADDNVHFQNTAEMANKLIAANKQFDTMIYPNRNHGISGGNAKIHLYTLMTRFLDEKLKGETEVKVTRP